MFTITYISLYTDDVCSVPSRFLVLLQAPRTICSFKWFRMAHSQQFITSTAGFPNQSWDITLVMYKLTERSLPNTNKTVSAVNCCQKLLLIQPGLCFDLMRHRSNRAQVPYTLLIISSLKLKECHLKHQKMLFSHQQPIRVLSREILFVAGTPAWPLLRSIHSMLLMTNSSHPFWTCWHCELSYGVRKPTMLTLGCFLSVTASSELSIRWGGTGLFCP